MVDAIIEGIKDRVGVAIKINQSVGIQVPENRHENLRQALFTSMSSNAQDTWTFVTISNTYDYLVKKYKHITELPNVRFIDCISRVIGISELDKHCTYIESPTMLEKTALEIINSIQTSKNEGDKYIVIDSLSALMIYNDSEIIREFVYFLMNRTRAENVHLVTIVIEEEMDTDKLIQLNDKIIVLRDSFIE
ncbi:MAG: hypothetical protein QXL17_04630 [Candidatus Thermoplasmatota archaeon]